MRRPSRSQAHALIGIALVVVLGLNIAFALTNRARNQVAAAERSASTFVEKSLPGLMSYQPDALRDYRDRSLRLTAGKFKAELGKLLSDGFIKDATDRGVGIRTSVQSSATVARAANKVTLLVYINQWRTTKATKAPTLETSRLTVTVERDGGPWRVSGLDPL